MHLKITSKCSIVFVTFILLSTIFFQNAIPPVAAEEPDEKTASERILEQLGVFLANNVYSFFSFGAPALVVKPGFVEIGYNESVSFEIGLIDLKTQEFKDDSLQKIMSSESLTFEVLQFPSNNIDKRWRVTFDPPEVNFEEGNKRKTTATLSLSAPPVGGQPLQSGELIIQINRNRAYKDLWHYGPVWFFFALTGGWGRLSGQVDIGTPTVTLLVKVKPYHEAIIEVPELVQLQPNQIVTLPIDITNLGNYKDTLGFRIVSENKGVILSDPIDTTLLPGETKRTLLGIGVDPNLIDTGTIHEVDIEAFSLSNPNQILASRTVILETRGFYISEGNLAGFMAPVLLVFLIIIFFIIRRRKQLQDIAQKPEKPWMLPQEKAYLEKLKEKDKEQYKNTLEQMKQEYTSALLWYKHYVQAILDKKKSSKYDVIDKLTAFFSDLKKRIVSFGTQLKNSIASAPKTIKKKTTQKEARPKQEPKKEKQSFLQKIKPPQSAKPKQTDQQSETSWFPLKKKEDKPSKKEKPKPVKKRRKAPSIDPRKQQLLNKIKKEQKKQKRKWRGA